MAWRRIGQVTVTPETEEAVIGPVEVAGEGGIEVRVRELTPYRGFRFGYGLLSFVSPLGRELGSIKVHPKQSSEDYRLGAGLTCQSRYGNLTFSPRAWNLRWVRAGFPWTVEFYADVDVALPLDRHQTPGFVDAADRLLGLAGVGTQGRIQF